MLAALSLDEQIGAASAAALPDESAVGTSAIESVPVTADMPKAQIVGAGEVSLAKAMQIVMPKVCADVGVSVVKASKDGEVNGLEAGVMYLFVPVQKGVKIVDNGEAEAGDGIIRRTVMFMADRKKNG